MKYRVIALSFFLFSFTLLSFIPVDTDTLLPKRSKNKKQDKTRKGDKLTKESDWLFYAETAKYYLDNEQSIEEVLELIDHSLDLQVNATNLEIKGDYYRKIGDLHTAFEHYQKAIQLCVFDISKKFQLKTLQNKALNTTKLIKRKKEIGL